mmetsp:Transcript_111085/g.313373  ORF Transcript_111085/g.313373 Transcript_111085/m.313373 type:complete len:246 (+) Transcript_111085:74-811(+)
MLQCHPASQFCCGCSVEFGVWVILVGHLGQCCFSAVAAGCLIIGQSERFMFVESATTAMVVAAIALIGIPLILLAMCGMRWKQEVPLRIYLWYFLICVVVDLGYATWNHILPMMRCNLPSLETRERHMEAFACGASRGSASAIVFLLTAIQMYMVFIVASHCENIAEGGCCPDFKDLDAPRSRTRKSFELQDTYGIVTDYVGRSSWISGPSDFSGNYPMSGWGSSRPILGGMYHCMAYPPPSRYP